MSAPNIMSIGLGVWKQGSSNCNPFKCFHVHGLIAIEEREIVSLEKM